MEPPKLFLRSKSYFTDDDDSVEELLLHLINEFTQAFALPELSVLSELVTKTASIKELLLTIDSYFCELSKADLFADLDLNSFSFDHKYSEMKAIISSTETYLLQQNEKGATKFITNLNLTEMININNLIKDSRIELHKFAKLILVVIAISESKDKYLNRLSEGQEIYLDFFLDIIQKFIDLTDSNIAGDNIDWRNRRFTTRTSVLFNFKDQALLFTAIDKLRKTIVEMQEEKESLLNSLAKAEEDNKELNLQLDKSQSVMSLYKVKEDDLHLEIQDYKEQLNSFNTSDHSMMRSEMLLVEKSQQLSELEERSTLKIVSLNHKISSLQKEILDMHMMNEQSSQLHQENQTLKDELAQMKNRIADEMVPLKEEKGSLKQKIIELERDNNSHQSKIMVLRNDLKVEKQKTEVQSKTIIALQNKFKEIEARPIPMIHPDLKPLPQEINEDKVKELLIQIQERELIICDLNKEISLMKQQNGLSQYHIQEKVIAKAVKQHFDILKCNHCIDEAFICSSSIASQKEISKQLIKSRSEIKKRDKDIDFLKQAYSELKTKSEEEYNMVSSSLYELALHLTKIKNEVYGSNNSNSFNVNNKAIA